MPRAGGSFKREGSKAAKLVKATKEPRRDKKNRIVGAGKSSTAQGRDSLLRGGGDEKPTKTTAAKADKS